MRTDHDWWNLSWASNLDILEENRTFYITAYRKKMVAFYRIRKDYEAEILALDIQNEEKMHTF